MNKIFKLFIVLYYYSTISLISIELTIEGLKLCNGYYEEGKNYISGIGCIIFAAIINPIAVVLLLIRELLF